MLFAILSGAVALVFFDPVNDKNAGVTSSAISSRPDGPAGFTDVDGGAKEKSTARSLALPERPALNEAHSTLFGARSWQPPPPKVTVAPVVPTAPPLPYRFAGKLMQDGKLQVFLSKGETAIPIKQGEILDGRYRVEAIGEDRITLVYLPLGHKETIPVNSSLQTAGAGIVGAGATGPASGMQAGLGTIPAASVIASAADASDKRSGSKPAQLLWVGPQQVKLGAQFSVALRVTSEQPVRASPMQFKFDPKLLETVAVKPGGFFGKSDRNFSYRVNPDGTIFVGASNPGPESAVDAEFLVLTFRPLMTASAAELSIASLNLQGAAGRPITYDQLTVFKTAITP